MHAAPRPPSLLLGLLALAPTLCAADVEVSENEERILISTDAIEAAVAKRGYLSGVYRQTFLDEKTGFRDPGAGLDIADFLLEPGSDRDYRDQLHEQLVYHFGDEVHGDRPKRKIEGPQICTQADDLDPRVIRGGNFAAVKQHYRYHLAAPGYDTGSLWEQTLVFPAGKRYFVSSQKITSANDSDALILRIDMPGHVRHDQGDTFSEIFLSYHHGTIPSSAFTENFSPTERFNYRRSEDEVPERFIRAVRLRDPETGEKGPWLAGMTLEPSVVHEAWCHQRNYVCMIEEFGGRPIREGESFSAAFVVGYFDSIDEMRRVYDEYAGHTGLEVDSDGWSLTAD